jgi:ubiquinone/menaquinone biosynthesis C-methylase UbiE
MSNSRSFDRASRIYDQTRPLLEPIAKYGIPAIVDIIGPMGRMLEVGCGTGRISIPLLERGVNWTGCDLSSNMLRQFQEKFPFAPIALADGLLLPFPGAQFDAVLTVHVMHLIPPWREVLGEFRRVLVPGGVYLNMSTWAPVGVTVTGQIRDYWRGWMAANGTEVAAPGVREQAELETELRSLGFVLSEEVEAVRFPYSFRLDEHLNQFASRSFSETWDLPDELFEASMKALLAWAAHEYGNLEREIQDEVRCVIHVARCAD